MMNAIQAKMQEIKNSPGNAQQSRSNLQTASSGFRKEYSMADFRTTMMSQRQALLKKRSQENAANNNFKSEASDIFLSSHRVRLSPALQNLKRFA
jgi:hypothetical protein